jgi:2-keto-3-deoxy-L-rhamnonate aldolase RhmA
MPNLLKQQLAENRLLKVFTVGRLCHPVVIEMFWLAGGYDAFWLDQEHAGLTTEQITVAAITARANKLGCFTRVTNTHYSVVTQSLESGVDGVMAARVMGAGDAEEFVRWCMFAPRGWRGMNTSGADGHYTGKTLAQLAADGNQNVFVAIQIETRSALDQAESIAAIDGVDLLFIGPSDLSAELGAIGQPAHPKVLEAAQHVDAACKKHGKVWGTIAVDPTFADRCAQMSRCRMLTFGNDCRALRDGIAAVKKTFGKQFEGT